MSYNMLLEKSFNSKTFLTYITDVAYMSVLIYHMLFKMSFDNKTFLRLSQMCVLSMSYILYNIF